MATTHYARSEGRSLPGFTDLAELNLGAWAGANNTYTFSVPNQGTATAAHSNTTNNLGIVGYSGTGSWTWRLVVTSGDSNITLTGITAYRLTALGEVQASTSIFASTQSMANAQTYTYNSSFSSLGTFATNEILAVRMTFQSAKQHGGEASITYTVDNEDLGNITRLETPLAEAGSTYDETGRSVTITESDSVTDEQGYSQSLSVTATFSDSVTDTANYAEALSVTATVSDSVADTQTFVDALSVTATFSDSVTDLKHFFEAVSDSFTITGSVTDLRNYAASLSVTATFSDSVTDVQGYADSLSVTATASDSVADTQTYVDALSDTVTTSDSVNDVYTPITGYTESPSDSFTITETVSETLTLVAENLSVTITASDSVNDVYTPTTGYDETGRTVTITATDSVVDTPIGFPLSPVAIDDLACTPGNGEVVLTWTEPLGVV